MVSSGSSEALGLRAFGVARPGTPFSAEVPELRLGACGAAALSGPSGCGKTSVLLGMLGLGRDLRTHGEVRLLGVPAPAAGTPAWRRLLFEDVTLILQDARAALDPLRSIGAQMEQATGASHRDIHAALADLGIAGADAVAARYPHQVSGGQAQRALLAIALLRRPRLLIADEPTAALDDGSIGDLVRALQLLRERTGTAVLVATHDHHLVAGLAAREYAHANGAFRRADVVAPPWPAWPPGDDANLALSCSGVSVRRGGRRILRDFSLELRRGQVVALVGSSGAGKTTLAKVLAGHVDPDAGSVRRHGTGSVQMLFQDAFGSLTPGVRIGDLVGEVAARDFDVVAEAARLGLSEADLARTAARLSGGERRRAALLRALAVRPAVLILDEPTASLDRATAMPVLETLLAAQRRTETAYLLITHDLELAEAVAADRIVHIESGGEPG